MRIVIISDIHGNYEALRGLPELHCDELWVLGDLVNYGPQPQEVIKWTQTHADEVVQGNHDHAVGYLTSPRCSPRFREMARWMQNFTIEKLAIHERIYLRQLPLFKELRRGRTKFYLCHAAPSDPLYPYYSPDSDRWIIECAHLEADVLLVGHTHIPFVRKVEKCLVVNPGSLGQPKHGKPEACYAIWEDGNVELRSFTYPVEKCVAAIERLDPPERVKRDLVEVLRTGAPPKTPSLTPSPISS